MSGSKSDRWVSIVVPVYNVAAYLQACLDSLVSQTYQKIEVILVNDGSTDISGEICDNYAAKDARVRVYHTENQGVSSARNRGIDEATGDYLIFVDADDYIHRELIECYLICAEADGVCMCGSTEKEEDMHQKMSYRVNESIRKYTQQEFAVFYAENLANPPWNKFYDLSLIKEFHIRFPEEKSMGEDLLFNLDYFRHASEQYRLMDLPLYYYRQDREESLSAVYRKDMFQIQQELADAVEQFMKDMQVWNPENQRIHYGLYWDRLDMTAEMCRNYEKTHKNSSELKKILEDPIWKEVWAECRKRKLCTWKREIKRLTLEWWKIRR